MYIQVTAEKLNVNDILMQYEQYKDAHEVLEDYLSTEELKEQKGNEKEYLQI